MRVSLKWLREYVDFDLTPEDLAHRLTMAGLEVGAIERVGGDWDNVLVGHVERLRPHPNADRLKLATVDTGSEQLEVICGAPNVEGGQKIVLARVGATLTNPQTGNQETLKAARIRGVVSEGMICSERELGLGDDHEGILVLPDDAVPGMPLEDYLGDVILDVEVTANRPDCLSMLGVAWEVGALTGNPVRVPSLEYAEDGDPITTKDLVDLRAPEFAPRYTSALITGVTVGPAPGWMQLRLKSAGVRPISNVVDITNYVMLEVGQPLHAFDRDTIAGGKLIVRRATPEEPLTTLDGRTHSLSTEDLVIADENGPVGLGGIMGGGNSEVSDSTTDIILESASFAFASTRRTVQRRRIEVGGKRGTEASQRFERNLPITLPPVGLRRAAKMLVELCGGLAAKGIADDWPDRQEPAIVTMTSERMKQVMGSDPGREVSERTLRSLGFELAATDRPDGEYTIDAVVPYWRTDIGIPDDLIEEVARIVGYDVVPVTLLPSTGEPELPDPLTQIKDDVRDTLVMLGNRETISYPLVPMELLQATIPGDAPQDPLRVWNRMSPDQEYLRTSLRGSLLRTLANNERGIGRESYRLFEIGQAYLPHGPRHQPEERTYVTGVLAGTRANRSWIEGNEAVPDEMDFFDAKGLVESLLGAIGVRARYEVAEDRILAHGRTAHLLPEDGGRPFGTIGEVHPDTLAALDIRTPRVVLYEINLHAVLDHRREAERTWQSVSRYPSVLRELSLLIDEGAPAGLVSDIIRDFPSIVRSSLVDVYQGPQVPDGKKSLAFSLVWQSPTRTLTDTEVDVAETQLLDKLQREAGATLRSQA
ncbi:MAG: phenylalanine--tRNA ligase subunit beta [Dehalococcoidia bacterium]|nr:phenylalanine--tRNA ligase subunit beta [Dehalococcoidia bacterium]